MIWFCFTCSPLKPFIYRRPDFEVFKSLSYPSTMKRATTSMIGINHPSSPSNEVSVGTFAQQGRQCWALPQLLLDKGNMFSSWTVHTVTLANLCKQWFQTKIISPRISLNGCSAESVHLKTQQTWLPGYLWRNTSDNHWWSWGRTARLFFCRSFLSSF